jgi:hypothetical protein
MYVMHEAIGARMLTGVSDQLTVALVAGVGPAEMQHALRVADDI